MVRLIKGGSGQRFFQTRADELSRFALFPTKRALARAPAKSACSKGGPLSDLTQHLRLQGDPELGTGGLQYREKVRTTPIIALNDTPVVFLTSDRQEEVIVLAKSLQVDCYIVKPVSILPLQKNLERILNVFVAPT
jgi:CheY-like chemotaxis protein